MAESWISVIQRADETSLRKFIGPDVVDLLNIIKPEEVTSSKLREMFFATTTFEELLLDKDAWNLFSGMLRIEEAIQACELLGQDSKNPYEALSQYKFKSNSSALCNVQSLFGDYPDVHTSSEEIVTSKEIKPLYPLFLHQRNAVARTEKILWKESSRVLLHMPTGSGKTRTAMHAICHHLSRSEKSTVIWLANSEELCSQAADEFEIAWKALGNRDVNIYRLWGGSNLDLEAIDNGFMIAGVDKLNSYLSRFPNKVLKLRSRVTLLVFDEAHQSIAPTYKELLDMFLSRPINPPSLLGLSATPGRTWRDREEDLRLAEFYQQNKVTLEVEGYENPVTYLIDKGYLAKPTFIQLSNESILEQNSIATNVLEIPNDLLKKLGDDTKRNVIIIKRLQELIQNHQRVMYFAPSVANAKTISRTLVAMGVDSMVVTGETPSSVRQKSILKFKSDANSPMIICNFGVLTTGFDAPRTSAALIARPTLSLVLYSQMVGRAIRGPLAGGNKNATIVTVIDSNLPGFRKVEEAFMNWEQVWQYQENERQE